MGLLSIETECQFHCLSSLWYYRLKHTPTDSCQLFCLCYFVVAVQFCLLCLIAKIKNFNMLKVTTKEQFQELFRQMELHPSIARGERKFGENKMEADAVWQNIATILNSLGPPIRTFEEWQRVWINFKAKLKIKMAKNKRSLASEEISLSPLEHAVADLLQIHLAVNPQEETAQQRLTTYDPEEQPLTTYKSEPAEQIENIEEQQQIQMYQQVPKINKTKSEEEKRIDLLEKQTGTQAKVLESLQKINQSFEKEMEILKDMESLKRKKYDAYKEEKKLNDEIKKKKLEILEQQIKDLNQNRLKLHKF